MDHGRDRRTHLRRLALVDEAPAVGLHARRRLRPRAARGRAAAGLTPRRHRQGRPRDFREAARHAGGSLGPRLRRPDPRRRLRAAQGELRRQLRPQVGTPGDAEGAADADRRRARRRARHPLLVPQGQRSARRLADRRRPGHPCSSQLRIEAVYPRCPMASSANQD